jgi:hypothetical protein
MTDQLTDNEIRSNLCIHDPRNPEYSDCHDPDDEPVTPRDNCFCDSCFRGLDRLAFHILADDKPVPVGDAKSPDVEFHSVQWEREGNLPQMEDVDSAHCHEKSEVRNGERMFPFIDTYSDKTGERTRHFLGA